MHVSHLREDCQGCLAAEQDPFAPAQNGKSPAFEVALHPYEANHFCLTAAIAALAI